MKQLTIRGFDTDLEQEIRSLAEEQNISLNKAVLRLIRRGAGLSESGPGKREIGTSLDHLAGTWTEEEVRKFEEAQDDFERIDADMWK